MEKEMYEVKPGGVVHVEMTSKDPAATRKFLEGVFGWKFKKQDMDPSMEYWTFEAGTGPAGGLTTPQEGMHPATLNYLLVESVEASVKKIKAHGGKIVMDRTEIPTVGWFAVYEIPGGVHQAIFEPKPGSMP
jgi:predicted enzyme related to lactoylglutathione lyase